MRPGFRKVVATALVSAAAGTAALAGFAPRALAAPVEVERHALRCNDAFPCPPQLARRVDFWIQVYGKWTSRQGVFHDSEHPERVYSVRRVSKGCSRKSPAVKKERTRIRNQLERIAERLEAGRRSASAQDRAVLALFPDASANAVRRAKSRVRCQQGNRDRFEAALRRYGAYGSLVEELIVEAGLPRDVHFLPFVESLYSPDAYSRVGAAGLWQIMPRTARSLGMELNATVDERLDVEAATLGAARYLKNSRERLTLAARRRNPSVTPGELSPFLITSYNYGVNGMRRAVEQFGLDFVAVLNRYRSPSFQVAVKNFYATFLAARHVAQNARAYFGEVRPDRSFRYHTVVLKHPVSIGRVKRVFGVAEADLKRLNRALTRFVWHGWRLVPKGYRLRLPHRAAGWKREIARLKALPPEDDSRRPLRYKVRRGDTACGIARALRVRCKDLVEMNHLGRRALIRVNQVLWIPGLPRARGLEIVPGGEYTVRGGDTVCGIALRNGVNCSTLLALNGLVSTSVIRIGQVLKLPGAAAPRARGAGSRPGTYTVRAGDTPCGIARRFGMDCRAFQRLNGLKSRSLIYVGQVLEIAAPPSAAPRPAPVAQLAAAEPDVVGEASSSPLDLRIDYKIKTTESGGEVRHYVNVEADETLGHFADWLGIGGSAPLRRLNGIGYNRPIHTGKHLWLPVRSAEQQRRFGEKREEYHRVLIEEFKENYRIVGVGSYTVQRGDSPWRVADRFQLPVWAITRYNPQLRQRGPVVGETLKIPRIEARG